MKQDRQWLRQFIRLDDRAEADGIPNSDVLRQEDTVLRALQMLEEQPGIILADEVGMGKTFEALGIAAAFHHRKPRSRIVVLTPGPDLNTKWVSEFNRFPYDFGRGKESVTPTGTLREFAGAVKHSPVTVAPVTMFQSGRGVYEQAYLLSLYGYWYELHGKTINAMIERALGPNVERVNVHDEYFLNTFELKEIEPYLERAFKRVDAAYKADGLKAFEKTRQLRRLLAIARSEIAGRLMPIVDLLIVDEAHKLKNPQSLRSEALQTVFNKRFRKAVFLTATPFQLDIAELKEVFAVFARARQAPADLMTDVNRLLMQIRDYQVSYDDFQKTWALLDPYFAVRFREAYDRSREDAENLDEPSSKVLLTQIDRLQDLKNTEIEPAFRKWMIRSLREEKRIYRKHDPKELPATGAGCLPFLIYERFIAELFRRQHRTHKAAAEINMVSSYSAARRGDIVANGEGLPAEADAYRKLLLKLLKQFGTGADGDHPKLRHVLSDALDAAENGEKTLIFCSRIATLRQLRRELDSVWEARMLAKWLKVLPTATEEEVFGSRSNEDEQKGRHALLQSRFHRTQDALYLALREPYLRTVAPLADWALSRLDKIVENANKVLLDTRVGKTSAARIDYQITKRCVEHAAANLWRDEHLSSKTASEGIQRMCNPDFLSLGLDLKSDEHESDTDGSEQPQWHITDRSAKVVLGVQGSLWEGMANQLAKLSHELRVRVVEQLSRYLTFKQVPFLAEFLLEAQAAGLNVDSISSEEILDFMPAFWETKAGAFWKQQLNEFLMYFISRDDQQQLDILDGPIRTGDFARHTEKGQSREKLREAFNTPLFPMVLIANEVMQEGLDLHKQCRRIVHHDLVWNPAQIEQRIGRIDRLGSLTSRMRETNSETMLDVLYPLIAGTIDQRLYRTVKTREKWLEFLLGAPPDFSEYCFDGEEPPPLPDRLAEQLAIDLSPKYDFSETSTNP